MSSSIVLTATVAVTNLLKNSYRFLEYYGTEKALNSDLINSHVLKIKPIWYG